MLAMRSSDALEPLEFAVLRGLTPPEVETVLYDERLEELPLDESADLVALTVETFTARRAFEIAACYRARGVPVVMGGYHPTLLPDETLEHADAIVEGDAEGVWGRVVEDARRGALARRYRGDPARSLAGFTADRGLFAGKRYRPLRPVQYGRGCRYRCDFCSIHPFYGQRLRQRPVEEVVEEIARLKSPLVFLVDDNIFVDRDRAKELFRALVPLKIRWACQVSIDIARDPELVELMRESGCTVVLVGFESLDRANLRQMNKPWNQAGGDYTEPLRVFREAGFLVYGAFVFGYDADTPASFEEAVEFAIENHLYIANFNPLQPMPGTPLFDRLRREGRLIHEKWWLDPDYRYGQAAFHPRGMTADELTEGCFRARRAFTSFASIGRRMLDRRTHLADRRRLGLYVLSNLTCRREIRRKQGRPLGLGSPAIPVTPPR
jgi:radical SAM superfamily enzyme YgiQ (UPF0313 family)